MSDLPVDVVVRTVDLQTTADPSDRYPVHKVVMYLFGHGNLEADVVRDALDEAVEEGSLNHEVEDDEDLYWIPEGYEVPHEY